MEITKLQDKVSQTRRDILRMVHKVNSGHLGGSFGVYRVYGDFV